MKLSDIIDYDLSYWNSLGKTGGTALPGNDKSVTINGVEVWKKHPPFKNHKKKKRIDEYQRGGQIDWQQEKGAEKFNPSGGDESPKFASWSRSTKDDDTVMTHDGAGRKKKITVKRVSGNSVETVDDEGNSQLRNVTGDIRPGDRLGKRYEGVSGAGPASSGATQPPVSGPSELEYDLQHKNVKKEFKGKDTRKEIKTSEDKRERFKKYLERRSENV